MDRRAAVDALSTELRSLWPEYRCANDSELCTKGIRAKRRARASWNLARHASNMIPVTLISEFVTASGRITGTKIMERTRR